MPRWQLAELLAPVALYPDVLLSQILTAATYPADLAEAARWSREHPSLQGEPALVAVMSRPWDASVKALSAFPLVIGAMDRMGDWTSQLGQAFLSREAAVMDAIQDLRHKAYTAGRLRSSSELRVVREGKILLIEPARPDLVFVPQYETAMFYGEGSGQGRVQWPLWPGYQRRSGDASGIAFGPAISLPSGLPFGGFDWEERHVHVASFRLEPLVQAAVLRRDEKAPASPAPVSEAEKPAPVQPVPAVTLTLPERPASLADLFSPKPSPRAERSDAPQEQAASKQDASSNVPPSLLGLARPDNLRLGMMLPRAAAPRAAPPTASERPEKDPALIRLMPEVLEGAQSAAKNSSGAAAEAPVKHASGATPATEKANAAATAPRPLTISIVRPKPDAALPPTASAPRMEMPTDVSRQGEDNDSLIRLMPEMLEGKQPAGQNDSGTVTQNPSMPSRSATVTAATPNSVRLITPSQGIALPEQSKADSAATTEISNAQQSGPAAAQISIVAVPSAGAAFRSFASETDRRTLDRMAR